MAVFQISKIQVRRGKLAGNVGGMPILSSGEFGWAIDTQELYIGNGSVSEGAPAVGNSKVITEHDNIFDIYSYQYKQNVKDPHSGEEVQTGLNPYAPTVQSVNAILDRTVWAENFGVQSTSVGSDLDVDRNTQNIQLAINELFLKNYYQNDNSSFNSYANPGALDTQHRVTLRFTPGVFKFSSTIYLPSFVSIEGSGIEKTVFEYTGTGKAFEFVGEEIREFIGEFNRGTFKDQNSAGVLFTTYLSKILETNFPARDAKLSNFTLLVNNSSTDGIYLNAVQDSEFTNLQLVGPWTNGITNEQLDPNCGIKLLSSEASTMLSCYRNKFEGIVFQGFEVGAYSKYSIEENTFNMCKFNGATTGHNMQSGIVFGRHDRYSDTFFGPRYNSITNCIFDTVNQHGIHIRSGIGNKSRGNKFVNVGNIDVAGRTRGQAKFSHIRFEVPGNSSLHDTFDRYDELSNIGYNATDEYVPEVEGVIFHTSLVTKQATLDNASGFVVRLPLNITSGYNIEYIYKSASQMRRGVLSIAVDKEDQQLQLTDEYECTNEALYQNGVLDTADTHNIINTGYIPSQHQQLNELLEFTAELSNNELVVNYTNDTGEFDGILTFTYTVLVHN